MTDWQLLRKFTDQDSQTAFTELSQRYTNLVYRVCLRELEDAALAEDASQAVFLILARKAKTLTPICQEATLSSWLFQTALLTSKNVRRQEQRRQVREQEAATMQAGQVNEPPGWVDVEPLLNEAIRALPFGQRTLILERFFQERPLAEIGAGQGISEDAARMRVNRALDRLRRFFAARNVTLSATALAAILPQAVRPAPAHAVEAIQRLSLAPSPSAANTSSQIIAQGAIHTMNLKRLRLQMGAAALVAVFVLGTAGAIQVTAQMKARVVLAEQQQDQTRALAAMDQMYATYAAMKSFKCHVMSRDDLGEVASDGDYEIGRPNKIRFKRFTLNRDMSGQTFAVSDGSNLFTTCTEGNSGVHGAADRYAKQQVRFVGPPNVPQDLSPWFASFGGINFSYGVEPDSGMPDVMLGLRLHSTPVGQMLSPVYSLGQPVVQDLPGTPGPIPLDVVIAHIPYVAGTTGRNWPGAAEVVTYYIGQRDHLLYKLTAADPRTSNALETGIELDTRTETYDSIAINSTLPASDFVFTPPSGSHEVRNTSDLFPGGRM
ncbi:MAG: RNA polymerase sigma factor [Janthinobacterium lividum]